MKGPVYEYNNRNQLIRMKTYNKKGTIGLPFMKYYMTNMEIVWKASCPSSFATSRWEWCEKPHTSMNMQTWENKEFTCKHIVNINFVFLPAKVENQSN